MAFSMVLFVIWRLSAISIKGFTMLLLCIWCHNRIGYMCTSMHGTYCSIDSLWRIIYLRITIFTQWFNADRPASQVIKWFLISISTTDGSAMVEISPNGLIYPTCYTLLNCEVLRLFNIICVTYS